MNDINSTIGMIWFTACLIGWVALALYKHRKHHYSLFRLGGLMLCLGSVVAYFALADERGWSLPPAMIMWPFDLGFTVLIAFRVYDEKYCDCNYPEATMENRHVRAVTK